MRRIAIGAVAGLAVWFGSAYAAEAQQITPTGPLAIVAGSTTATYSAAISVPSSMNMVVRVWVYHNGTLECYTSTFIPNPGTNNYNFNQNVTFNTANAGDTITFKATLSYNRANYPAQDWTVTVSGTRPPPSKSSYQKSSGLAHQGVSRDLRREE
jgi:hypothetical protein